MSIIHRLAGEWLNCDLADIQDQGMYYHVENYYRLGRFGYADSLVRYRRCPRLPQYAIHTINCITS